MAALTIPVLPSRDFDRTVAFYSPLGFTEQARYPGEYLIITHPAGIELHFFASPSLDPATNDAGCYVRLATADEARALHDEWADSTHGPPEETDYDILEFALLDPDRNLLRVGGPIGPPT